MTKTQNLKIKSLAILILIILSTFYFLLSDSVFADEPGDDNSVYLFHLYYDNDRLFADRDFEFTYDVIPEKFVPETYNTQFPFRGEVINFRNEVSTEFLFDPRRGDPDFLEGKISVKAPYISDGQKAVFYDIQGRTLVTIFVSESSFCNDDGVCNFDRGENVTTCPNDCRGVVVPPTEQDDSGQSRMMLVYAIYVLIIAGVVLGGWFGWRKYREINRNKEIGRP